MTRNTNGTILILIGSDENTIAIAFLIKIEFLSEVNSLHIESLVV